MAIYITMALPLNLYVKNFDIKRSPEANTNRFECINATSSVNIIIEDSLARIIKDSRIYT